MPIYEGYGLTETAPFASYNHRLQVRSRFDRHAGRPGRDEDRRPRDGPGVSAPGQPGEIAIRGPNVMLGYWNRPEETAAAIRDGWFYSGDIGQTDEHGYFYIVDRLKDMISVGGQKVFPAEVERVLLDHAAVAEAAVVGFADELMGEKVVAFVVQHTGNGRQPKTIRQSLPTTSGDHSRSRSAIAFWPNCRATRPARCSRRSCGSMVLRAASRSPAQ